MISLHIIRHNMTTNNCPAKQIPDTTFNESFAIAVEQESLRRWLATRDNLKASEDHKTYYRRRRQFTELVMKYRKELKALYAKDLPTPEKQNDKAAP